MTKRSVLLYLHDIIDSIEKINQYIDGMDFEGFSNKDLTFDAVIRNLEIIGEASKSIPEDIRNNYHDVPWKRMAGLRNIISHQYFGIDKEIAWKIIKDNLPEVRPMIQMIINDM